MKKIHYAIISYHRPECVTVRTLLDLGINKEDIRVFIQDEKDFDEYQKSCSGIKLILNRGRGCSVNRNNVLRHNEYSLGDWVCLLDDDILSFTGMKLFYQGGKAKATSRKIYDCEFFKRVLCETFGTAEEIGSVMWGTSPTGNSLFAKTRLTIDGEYSVNKLFQGGLVGHIVDRETYYNETYKTVEDYELQLKIMSSGRLTLRRNDISASKKPNRNYRGGLFDTYRTDATKNDLDRLCAEYSGYIKLKPDYSGVVQLT